MQLVFDGLELLALREKLTTLRLMALADYVSKVVKGAAQQQDSR